MNSSRIRARQIVRRLSAPAACVAATALSLAALASSKASAQTPVTQAGVHNVSDAAIPPAFSQVTDPVKAGIVSDWQHGSNRINGASSVTDYRAVLDCAKRVFSREKKFGMLYNALPINRAAPADYKTLINRRKMADLRLPVPASLNSCACFVN
ncbi:hypothetical protein [Paraburkholderia pallida]|uniref:Uncharacterized protein n=1 Tax=Paraburkholderia pallida TaxID=2547399 RepID=A0A4P7CZX1_9BURK|nr:hypothetical protein [Paraburkholderia pallida]QBQ99824.1 hypothetical protein E1956_22060 [Paraburkholderia pallida]